MESNHKVTLHNADSSILLLPSDKAPLITERTALLCALLYTVLYVAPFYLSPTLRSTPLQSRDAGPVIRARVRAVGLTCVACTVITAYVLAIHGHATVQDVAHLLGAWPMDLRDVVKVLGLVAVLFAGPLYESLVVDGDWRDWSVSNFKEALFDRWTGYRTYIIAPASEELVFRSLTISVYVVAQVDATRIVFITPLVFGLAHIHHLVDFLQSGTPVGRKTPSLNIWVAGIIRSLFQFTYTSLFGFFAAFVFLRTGNLLACIVAHTFCNWQGIPRFYGRVGQYAEDHRPLNITSDIALGKDDDDRDAAVRMGNTLMQDRKQTAGPAAAPTGPQNLGVGWTAAYYVLIFAGSYGFYALLWPLTASQNALAQL